jgi:DNA topoisomerase-1
MNLVIVESPAKCSKIQGFLGTGWKVLASMGHIRKLVEDLKALHIEKGFEPEFEFMSDKSKTIASLRAANKEATKVFLASDDDREGEMISYSIALALKLDVKTNPRIIFHEITKEAVLKSIKNPRTINMKRVSAQQGRAVLDLLIGFTISPLLWSIRKGLSAGRCQTPALRIIVERENEISNHVNTSSFVIRGLWEKSFTGQMIEHLESEEDAQNYLENIHDLPTATIKTSITKPTTFQPPLPLITSTLQQEASALYGSNPKVTMKVAQKLYEAGLITYMRTDSTLMSEEARGEARKQVESKYGQEYVSYTSKATLSNGAHECIRPTKFTTEVIGGDFGPLDIKIYNLIYKRAIQSIMSPAKGEERRVHWVIDGDPNEFIHEGVWRRTTFQGWKIVGQSETDLDEKEEEQEEAWNTSEKLAVDKKIHWSTISAEQKHTSLPSRYNEATLVRELEKKGIGRPSTYASLVASIIDKEYVKIDSVKLKAITTLKLTVEPNILPCKRSEEKGSKKEDKKKLVPTDLGKEVYTFCVREFSNLFDYQFTKEMELKLDDVENGSLEWKTVCSDTWNSYKDKYTLLKSTKKPVSQEDDIIGHHEDKPLIKKKGPYGYYVQYDGKNIKFEDNDTVETLIKKLSGKNSSSIHTLGDYEFKTGPYGKYMIKKGLKKPMFVSIPNELDVKLLTLEAASRIYEIGVKHKKNKR